MFGGFLALQLLCSHVVVWVSARGVLLSKAWVCSRTSDNAMAPPFGHLVAYDRTLNPKMICQQRAEQLLGVCCVFSGKLQH